MHRVLLLLAFSLYASGNPTPISARDAETRLEAAGVFAPPSTTVHHASSLATVTNPLLYTCAASNCADCTAFSLLNIGQSNCFWAGPFVSVALIDPSLFYAPNVIDIAPENCVDWVSIPQQGLCYNIVGETFDQYGSFH